MSYKEFVMKKQLKSFAKTAGTAVSLLAITITSVAASPSKVNTGAVASAANPAARSERPAAACTKIQASDVYWVTVTEEGDIDQKVETYPEGATKVTAAFDYNCIPKKTKLNVVWSIDGEQVLTDSSAPKPTDKANSYSHSIFMKNGDPLPNGEYGIEFYIGEDLLTSGNVTVGGEVTNTGTTTETTQSEVTVQGTVVDAKSKKPITGALVVVLNDGVDAKQWLKDGQDSDVMAFAKTDSKGQFELNNKVPTGAALPWVIGAKGYKTILQQDFTIEEGAEDPYVLNVALERQK
jgi:hypothetical protein